MNINKICELAHENASLKGFYEDLNFLKCNRDILGHHYTDMINNAVAARLALIHAEVSEALEALRKDDYPNFQEELGDIVIRVCDLAGYLKLDLEDLIAYKMEKNSQRPYKHGKRF